MNPFPVLPWHRLWISSNVALNMSSGSSCLASKRTTRASSKAWRRRWRRRGRRSSARLGRSPAGPRRVPGQPHLRDWLGTGWWLVILLMFTENVLASQHTTRGNCEQKCQPTSWSIMIFSWIIATFHGDGHKLVHYRNHQQQRRRQQRQQQRQQLQWDFFGTRIFMWADFPNHQLCFQSYIGYSWASQFWHFQNVIEQKSLIIQGTKRARIGMIYPMSKFGWRNSPYLILDYQWADDSNGRLERSYLCLANIRFT